MLYFLSRCRSMILHLVEIISAISPFIVMVTGDRLTNKWSPIVIHRQTLSLIIILCHIWYIVWVGEGRMRGGGGGAPYDPLTCLRIEYLATTRSSPVLLFSITDMADCRTQSPAGSLSRLSWQPVEATF